ncbi:MAG TPA: hypothetical protein VFL13_13295 [Candidatus Baltobacteraceae bacterium]|nr:hypothetical protein [Candidatus Baltobacteraceae bacterium]
MKSRALLILAALAATAACSGNFATGTGMPQTQNGVPPVSASGQPPYDNKGMTQNGSPSPNPSLSPGVASGGTYPIADAQKGFTCPPTIDGYGCELRFNLPAPTPTPAPAKGKKGKAATPAPTATPSPTPSPSPSPSPDEGASPGGKPTPTPTPPPSIVLKNESLPKDAPAMVHTPAGSLDTVPLMMVHLTPNADFIVNGWAEASFTLPKEQVQERGFAVQLFKASVSKKRTTYEPIWTFDKSTLKENTLTFSFDPPKTTIPKGGTYVLVLYGDDKSKVTSPAPAATGSSAPATSAPATPGASPSAVPTGSP